MEISRAGKVWFIRMLTDTEIREMTEEIRRLAKEKDALILAHYYQRLEVQMAADIFGDSFELAKKAKELNLDAIHDTVHEMAKDEARHGKAFEGLLKRYFK